MFVAPVLLAFVTLLCFTEVFMYQKLKTQCFSSFFSRYADAGLKECHFPVFSAAILDFWP